LIAFTQFDKRPRLQDPPSHVQQLPDLEAIANRKADVPLSIPPTLPTTTARCPQYRFSDTSIYDYLETNIDSGAMSFSQEPMSAYRTPLSIKRHGPDTPFRHWKIVQEYIEALLNRKGYDKWVCYNTTVELVSKVQETGKWKVTLREEIQGKEEDHWWIEEFDAIVVASGHYNVPYIPHIEGLAEWAEKYPGSVEHSKSFRGPEKYSGKVRMASRSVHHR
jgi:cation diffusion facilitator CzcD-associated flavoprotein CzcO